MAHRENSTFENNEDDRNREDLELDDVVPLPPDGSYGWVIVFASFMANLIVDGISYCFGIFISDFVNYFQVSEGLAALANSLLIGMYLFCGPIVSGLVNRYGSRAVMMSGSLLGAAGFFLCVFAPHFIEFLLLYGICGGIGFGLIYLPAIVHVGYYFEQKRALATGIAVSGSGFGTFVFGPLSAVLLQEYGDWKGPTWIFAGFILNCAVFGALLKPLPMPHVEKKKEQEKPLLERMWEDRQQELKTSDSNPKFNNGKLSEASENDADSHRHKDSESTISLNDGDVHSRSVSIKSVDSDRGTTKKVSALVKLTKIMEAEPAEFEDHGLSPTESAISSEPRHSMHAELFGDSRHTPSVKSRHSRQSVRTYVKSLHALNDDRPFSEHDLAAAVRELSRPINRSDIFLAGSIKNLPQFKGSGGLRKYRESVISLPPAKNYTLIQDREASKFGKMIPKPIRDVLFQMLDFSLLKDIRMVLLALSNVMGMLAFYVPFVYIVNHAENNGITKKDASFLISIIGITNTLGRIIFGWIADRQWISALTINNGCLFICGCMTMIVPLLTTFGTLAAFSAIFGFFLSSYISLTSIILVDIFGLEKLTNAFGVCILFRGIAVMAGAPLAGAVYNATGSYTTSFVCAGVELLGATFLSCMIAVVNRFCFKSLKKYEESQEKVQL